MNAAKRNTWYRHIRWNCTTKSAIFKRTVDADRCSRAKKSLAFGNQVFAMLKLTILITLLVGVVCSYIISRRLASPIAKLSEEVAEAQGSRDKIPKLSGTGIRELDQFSDAITQLSQDVEHFYEIPAYYGNGECGDWWI